MRAQHPLSTVTMRHNRAHDDIYTCTQRRIRTAHISTSIGRHEHNSSCARRARRTRQLSLRSCAKAQDDHACAGET